MSDSPRPSAAIYGGLFAVTVATLMHEILLTRIFSVTMWYHFAFMAISIAMFGMTVGALVVFRRPAAFFEPSVETGLARAAFLYAVTLVLGFLVFLKIPFLGDSSPAGIAYLTLSYTVIAIPFVWSGIVVALVLSTYRAHAASLYAADLLGAALGCVLLVFTLDVTDAASAILVVGAAAALGAAAFAGAAGPSGHRGRAIALAAGLGLAAVVHTGLVAKNQPLISVTDTAKNTEDAYRYVRWNSHSRVTVSGDPNLPIPAAGWGLSEKTGSTSVMLPQLGMTIDTWAGTAITRYDGDTSKLAFLRDDVTNVAHHLRPASDVFVVGVGGGRDVLSALVFGQKSVTGVEVNRDVLRASTVAFADFAGHYHEDPRVTLAVDEARSYLTRQQQKFDIVQISLIDTWAATAAGAFVLTENSLYTVEAWTAFLDHLTPRGILTVSRWYYPTRPSEAIRALSLARAALERIGVTDPEHHVLMVKAPKATGMPGAFGNGIATILVARERFTAEDLALLERETARMGFELPVAPGRFEHPTYETILRGKNLERFYDEFSLDVSAPTDDRPFFFQMLRLRDVAKSLETSMFDPNRANLEAIRLLAILLGIVTVLTLGCIVAPLALQAERSSLRGAGPLLGFFLAIGLGFMFVEVSEMQRLMLLLGKPIYALSVVLFTLLVGSGIGSLSSAAIVDRLKVPPLAALGGLIALLTVVGAITPSLVAALAPASTPARIGAAAAMLLPMGFAMGLPFPLGLRLAGERSVLVPWLWGINGAASVLCSVLAMVVALGGGISASYWCGVAAYGGALAAYAVAARRVARTAA